MCGTKVAPYHAGKLVMNTGRCSGGLPCGGEQSKKERVQQVRTVWHSGSASASVTEPGGQGGPGGQCAGPAGQLGFAPAPTSPAAPPLGPPACHSTHALHCLSTHAKVQCVLSALKQ